MDAARRTYAVIGTGGIGGLYGARLAAAGHAVTFVARSDAAALAAHGLRVISHVGADVSLEPDDFDVVVDAADASPADVVLVTMKSTANGKLASLLGPLVRPGSIVVVMQNGLGVDEAARAAAPGATVLAGLCFVCAQRVAPGRIEHLDYGAVTLAEHTADGAPAGVTAAVEAVRGDLLAAGVEATARDDAVAARWQKLMWNVPYNGLSVVLDAGTDELSTDPAARALVTRLMAEVEAASVALGHPVGDGFAARMRANTETMVPYAPSMKLDFEAGRPMEIGAIYDVPVAVAASAGAPMPTVAALAEQLHFLDARRQVEARGGVTRGDETSRATPV